MWERRSTVVHNTCWPYSSKALNGSLPLNGKGKFKESGKELRYAIQPKSARLSSWTVRLSERNHGSQGDDGTIHMGPNEIVRRSWKRC